MVVGYTVPKSMAMLSPFDKCNHISASIHGDITEYAITDALGSQITSAKKAGQGK